MKIKRIAAAMSAICVAASSVIMPIEAAEKLPAFPGAEGGGMYASGARAAKNIEVYHVTTLEDSSKKGTLRDAVSGSNRIVVFDVAGNIELKNALNITGNNLTILGQTAPGDGICIKDHTVSVYANNVILRYLRFRMGDALDVEADSLGGRSCKNLIVDHCSVTWSVDECASFYENTDFTMQWCIIAESLRESVHQKGTHGYGGIWGGQNAAFHHNLIAHHDSRNPRIATAGIEAAQSDVTKQTDLTELRNNVVYNWGANSAYGGENGAPVNLVNCYYKPGPSTASSKTGRLFQISAKKQGDNSGTNNLNCPGWGTDLYVSGNYVEGNAEVTADNTKGVDTDANTVTYGLWTDANMTDAERTVHERYISDYPITTQTAQEAYEAVLEKAGASIVRDAADERIINNVKNGTGAIINTPSDTGDTPYPTLSGTKAKDSDNDGIPNEWEDAHGLDKRNAADGLAIAASGYTNLEEYANALADGSYVRNTDYDPDMKDYDPTNPDDPDATAAPTYKIIDTWTAASGDENKAAGVEFMPGLTGVIQLSRAMTNTVNYDDGRKYSYAITHKDTSGGFSGGKATGCAMKYTAPETGHFTLYAYSVSGTKTFYAVEEGKSNPDKDAIVKKDYTGDSVPIVCSIDVEKGKTCYFYIKSSKCRFVAAEFGLPETAADATAAPTTAPTATPKPTTAPEQQSGDGRWTTLDDAFVSAATSAADRAPFGPVNGISGYGDWTVKSADVTYTHTDGTVYNFKSSLQAGSGSAERRCFRFTPKEVCTVTVVYSAEAGRPMYIYQGNNRLASGEEGITDGHPAVITAEITDASAGEVYVYGGSSNKQLYGIFADYASSAEATPEPTSAPTATPEPTSAPTATPEPTSAPTATPEPTSAPTATPEPYTYKVSAARSGGSTVVTVDKKADGEAMLIAAEFDEAGRLVNVQSVTVALSGEFTFAGENNALYLWNGYGGEPIDGVIFE